MQTLPPHLKPRPRRLRAADKSRFKFQKLLQPFTLKRGIVMPIIWFLLDWLVLGVAIASLLVIDPWWVKIFASLVAALWIARLVRHRPRCLPRLVHAQ